MAITYWTDFALNTLNKLNLSTGANTVLETVPAGGASLDSVVLIGTKLFYTLFWGQGIPGTGSVRSYDINSAADAQLATGFSDELVDLVADPSGTTLTVSDRGANELVRVTLSSGAKANLAAVTVPDGLAYDPAGHLFVVTHNSGRTSTIILKLDATTGSVLATGATLSGYGDGMTYDPVTGHVWVGWDDGTMKAFSIADCSLVKTSAAFTNSIFDGVASDGAGMIWACDETFASIRGYTIASDSWTGNWQPAGSVQPDDLCIPLSSTPTQFAISLFGTKRYGKLKEPECHELPELPKVGRVR